MEKKELKSFAINCRKTLRQFFDDDNIIYRIFINYCYIKVLLANNLISSNNQVGDAIKLLPNFIDEKIPNLENYIHDIPESSNFKNVENLGWLFQYFQNALKSKARKGESKSFEKDEIPTTTQIFTPKWLVKYMVNNTLGQSLNLENLEYIVNTKTNNDLNIKEIKFLDPCMGTGNILLLSYSLLYEKYLSLGYNPKEACKSILENNIYGFEIDSKPYEIALFSFQVLALINKVNDLNINNLNIFLINNPKGSLLREHSNYKINKALNMKYDFVCTNPPYLGKKNINLEMRKFLELEYPLGKSELYAAFICRCLEFVKDKGYVSMITIHSWMFINSFKEIRNKIIDEYSLESLLHTGANTFEDINNFNALACAFVICNEKYNIKTCFIKLNHVGTSENKQREFTNDNNYYYIDINIFKKVPDTPFVYYADEKIINLFVNNKKIKDVFDLRQGLATGNNKKYVRYWYEVPKEYINFKCKNIEEALNSESLYFPYNKGGKYCKWYGNTENVILFNEKAYQELSKQGNNLPSKNYYFKKGITWSLFGFENFGVKYKNEGFIFDVSGSTMFGEEKYLYYVLGFLSSNLCFYLLSLLAPTVNFQVGNIKNLPIIIDDDYLDEINRLVCENINICKENWNNQDVSWDFTKSPYLKYMKDNLLSNSFIEYQNRQVYLRNKLRRNEERLNEIFSIIYNISTIKTSVSERDLSIKYLDESKEIKDLINYLIGIILGRYKLENYESYLYINMDYLIEEIQNCLIILFGEKNYIKNCNYLDKINLEKYLINHNSKQFLNYLDKHFHKNGYYFIIDYHNSKYIFDYMNINEVCSELLNIDYEFNFIRGLQHNKNKLENLIKKLK